MRKIVLCNRGSCCPEVHIDGDEVRIVDEHTSQDDFILTYEQFEILKDKIIRGEFY